MSLNPIFVDGKAIYLRNETDLQILTSPRFCHYIYTHGDLKDRRCDSLAVKGKRYCQRHIQTKMEILPAIKEC